MPESHHQGPILAHDRKVLAQVDKALALFDNLDEWADYVSFLSKLQKALHFIDDNGKDHQIPRANVIANKLSLCLLPNLPNGVHQKTLAIYQHIFSVILQDTFTREAPFWLTGLLPLLSYCSMQLRPQLLALFRDSVFPLLSTPAMANITKPLVMALLLGMDDENSDTFSDALSLMDLLREKANNDSLFWLHIFLCIIRNPERRLGALQWCTRRLPLLGPGALTTEARACLSPEPGLLIRAFASALSGFPVSLSQEIIIVRGFFDLLLSHAPLHSEFYNELVSPKDKDLIIMAAARVSLRKDMGLNRRLWAFLLGPEVSAESASLMPTVADYFEKFALESLQRGLTALADNDGRLQEAIRISLAITFEKWEISKHIIPRLFVMFLEKSYSQQDNAQLITTALAFFDSVEPVLVWKYAVDLIKAGELQLLLFLLTKFNFNYDEITTTHVPMAILCLLCGKTTLESIVLFEKLLELVSPKAWESFSSEQGDLSRNLVLSSIDFYYKSTADGESIPIPSELKDFLRIALDFLCDAYAEHITDPTLSPLLAKHVASLLGFVRMETAINSTWHNSNLTLALKKLDNTVTTPNQNPTNHSIIALGIVAILVAKPDILERLDMERLIKILMASLWESICTGFPSHYQVESVKAILSLHAAFLPYYIQAGVIECFKKLPICDKAPVFTAFWGQAYTSDTNIMLLEHPIQILFDTVDLNTGVNSFALRDFIETCLKDGSTAQFMKLVMGSLLEFEFLEAGYQFLTNESDLARLAYNLKNLAIVLITGSREFHEFLKNEPIDEIFIKITRTSSVISYKSLLISICLRLLEYELDPDFTTNESNLWAYLECLDALTTSIQCLITKDERNIVQQFTSVVESVMYWIEVVGGNPEVKELIVCKLLKIAAFYLDLADEYKIELYVNADERHSYNTFFGRLFTIGVKWTRTNVLLAQWKVFLAKSLRLLGDRVFEVLDILDDAILRKLNWIVEALWQEKPCSDIDDIDGSINILLSCLEELLLTSHSYSGSNRKGSRGEKTSLEGGFFGNVMQGVFLIEAPATAQLESDKSQSVLTSFQNAVYTSFKIWMWGDARSSVSPEPTKKGQASLTNLAHKLRFRSRRLLETLMSLEKQQVLETLIKLDPSHTLSCKLVTIIDGGRYQLCLSKVFDSIISRSVPELLDEKKLSSLSVEISASSLSSFMLFYIQKMDSDSIGDVWSTCMQYMKDVSSHPGQFHDVIFDALKLARLLAKQLVSNKNPEKRKFQKELADEFLRLLTAAVSCPETKSDIQDAALSSIKEEYTLGDGELLYTTLTTLVPDLGIITEEREKVVSCLNVIISYTLAPVAKTSKPKDYPMYVISLITSIGKVHQGKQWKSIISDVFFDSQFLDDGYAMLCRWNEPLLLWIESDPERFVELIHKATTHTVTTGSIFRNEAAETQAKVSAVKRLSYLIMNGPQNRFLTQLELLFGRIEHSLRAHPSSVFRAEILTLFRAITLKFDCMFLLSYWAFITQEIVLALNIATESRAKLRAELSLEDVALVLSACKLLDQLLLLGYDDFNLNEWLFTSSSPEALSHTLKEKSIALVDKISNIRNPANHRGAPVNIEQPSDNSEPLLKGVKLIVDISQLRLFFDNLSWINFERVFGMFHVNRESCEDDVINDLF